MADRPVPSLIRAPEAAARMDPDAAGEAAAYSLGIQAVQWGMQWVKGGLVFRAMTAPLPPGATRPPFDPFPHAVNAWGHAQELITHEFRAIETPNTETLYSTALLDLAEGPVVVVHPDYPGAGRQDGGGHEAQGPARPLGQWGHFRNLPDASDRTVVGMNLDALLSIANLDLAEGRVGPDRSRRAGPVLELDVARRVERRASCDRHPCDERQGRRLREQIMHMAPEQFFSRLNELLVDNPAYPADAPVLERVAAIGVGPGLRFPWDDFPAEVQAAIAEGVKAGIEQIRTTPTGEDLNGWMLTRDIGRFGTKYALRAAWTLFGVGGNLVEDACYPMAHNDADGNTLDGRHRYRLRFPGQPPVEAFWSIYLYKIDGFLVENQIDRYMLGSRSDLAYDDGSLTIAIQPDEPTDVPTSNWLPGPKEGPFTVAMRLYLPKPEVRDGTWQPPGIERVD